jgi:hypothetical protein
VTGCLSLQIGAWAGAKSLLDRAAALAGRASAFEFEVRLFHCMARRLAADQREFAGEYSEVKRQLKDLASREGAFGRTNTDPRVRNEQLALDLCELAFLTSQPARPLKQLRSATRHWISMRERFSDRLTDRAVDSYWQAISRQYILNSFNLFYWSTVFETEIPDELRRCVEIILDRIGDPEYSYVRGGFHGKLYPMLAAWALEDGADRADLTAAITACIDEALATDEETGFAFDVPFADKAEFVGILRRLDPARPLNRIRLS